MHGLGVPSRLRRVGAISLALFLFGLAITSVASASTTSNTMYALGSYKNPRGERSYSVCTFSVSQRTTLQSGYDDIAMMGGVTCVEVRALDENGNVSASASATIAITTTPSPGGDDIVRAPVGSGSGQRTYNVDVLVDGELADTDEGFRVQLELPDGSRIVDETREDGTALFRGLLPGTYTVRAIGLSDEPEMVTRAQEVQVQDNGSQQVQARSAVNIEDVCAAFADSLAGFADAA